MASLVFLTSAGRVFQEALGAVPELTCQQAAETESSEEQAKANRPPPL